MSVKQSEYFAFWVSRYIEEKIHVDCATTVMLKILDGKCKMITEEKQVMELLYDQVKEMEGELLDQDVHNLIDQARKDDGAELKEAIYELRLMAETMISRPVMKAFKSMIRKNGLFQFLKLAV